MTIVAARAFDIRLRVSTVQRKSMKLGRLALRAISAGVTRPDKLRGFLGLNREVFAELMVELLRQNWILFNVRSGTLALPPGNPERDDSSIVLVPNDTRNVELCYLSQIDVITQKRNLWRTSYPSDWKVLPLADMRRPDELNSYELRRAANRVLPRQLEANDVMDVAWDPGMLEIDVVRIGGSSGDGAFVASPRGGAGSWTRLNQMALEEALEDMRDKCPALWGQIAQVQSPPRTKPVKDDGVYIHSLADVSAGLERLAVSDYAANNTQELESLLIEADALLQAEVTAKVFVGSSTIRAAVEAMIKRAQNSIVVSSAFASEHGASWLEQAFTGCGRGVLVGVSCGMGQALSEAEMRIIKRLHGSLPAMTSVSEVVADFSRGGSSHAKFAVADQSCVLITTCNVLSTPPDSTDLEVGVQLEGPGTGEIVPLLARCLSPRVAEMIHEGDGTSSARVPSDQRLAALKSVRDAIDILSSREDGEGVEQDGTDHVVEQVLTNMGAIKMAQATIARGIPTLQHRIILLDAIETAQQWVLIAAHRLSGFGFNQRLADTIRHALERHVRIGILWGELAESGDVALGVLKELASQYEGRLFFNETPLPWHAKLIIVDGRSSVVGSYEYLNLVANQNREVAEFSALVHCASASDSVLAGIRTWASSSVDRLSVITTLDGLTSGPSEG